MPPTKPDASNSTISGYFPEEIQVFMDHAFLRLLRSSSKESGLASTSIPDHPYLSSNRRLLECVSPSAAPASKKNPGFSSDPF